MDNFIEQVLEPVITTQVASHFKHRMKGDHLYIDCTCFLGVLSGNRSWVIIKSYSKELKVEDGHITLELHMLSTAITKL